MNICHSTFQLKEVLDLLHQGNIIKGIELFWQDYNKTELSTKGTTADICANMYLIPRLRHLSLKNADYDYGRIIMNIENHLKRI